MHFVMYLCMYVYVFMNTSTYAHPRVNQRSMLAIFFRHSLPIFFLDKVSLNFEVANSVRLAD